MTQLDLLCFSHLRWALVVQRPNHLMLRAARERRVFFIEEPIFDATHPWLEKRTVAAGLMVCVPHLVPDTDREWQEEMTRALLTTLRRSEKIAHPVVWTTTPMMVPLLEGLMPSAVVYDCLDDLSAFDHCPAELPCRERLLLALADLVFTAGEGLYQSRKKLHPAVHVFPSSVDAAHFQQARTITRQPADQASIMAPRIGFFGVIDERIDTRLLARIADARPHYHFVMLGPVLRIHEDILPERDNLHYLGAKPYSMLPAYLSGWDVAMMPWVLTGATRFISPTKTLEYLAAGCPVVSTPIAEVVHAYGESGLVSIADADGFARCLDHALQTSKADHRRRCDALVAQTSWDKTWAAMSAEIDRVVERSVHTVRERKFERAVA